LNQAFECLDSCDFYYKIERLPKAEESYCIEIDEEYVMQGTLALAICKAVLKAQPSKASNVTGGR